MKKMAQEKINKGFLGGTILLGIAIVVVVVLAFMCTYKINPGYAGVVYNADGGMETTTLGQGYHITWPWQKVIEYPVSTETVHYSKSPDEGKKGADTSIWVSTKDSKQISVDVTYTYHMDQARLPEIFTTYRGRSAEDIEATIMKNAMYQAINEVTSQYRLMEVAGDKLPDINTKILMSFKAAMEQDGIVVETMNLSNARPDQATADAIQSVINAQNALEQSKVEKQQAEITADKARTVAKGKADAAIIEAEGQAQANSKLSQSLTPMIIQYQYATRWDGKYPNVVAGSDSGMLLNITQ